jgi:hypothetical protein
MNGVNQDQEQSSILDKIDSGLTAEIRSPRKKKAVLSKGDSRYWLEDGRLFKNHGAADYSCRFTTLSRREHFHLGSQNKKTAAAKAAEIYSYIQANGWESALQRYKPKEIAESAATPVTLGELIEAATKVSSARRQTWALEASAVRPEPGIPVAANCCVNTNERSPVSGSGPTPLPPPALPVAT